MLMRRAKVTGGASRTRKEVKRKFEKKNSEDIIIIGIGFIDLTREDIARESTAIELREAVYNVT